MTEKHENKRCAIYCRKSTDEGLDAEFNSLDAQREACENYVAIQKANGWVCLPERYDDGGFSGGNMNRPALKKLMDDAQAGLIDVIVVYKIDRLSRSLCDFAELSKKLDKLGVAFVSVTQEINTHTSAGRMMLNILMTFAQFEREVIAERIRDKMAASRMKGKWVGGGVPLGYVVENKKLIVMPEEAETVKYIFRRFLEIQSPKSIAHELNMKQMWTKRGKPWNNSILYRLLNNYHYIGKVEYKGEIYQGEHQAIIDDETWNLAHEILNTNAPVKDHTRTDTQQFAASLRGILRCGHCNSAMTPYRTKRWGRTHYYYRCNADSKRDVPICPVRNISAGDIERIVYREVKKILVMPEIVLEVAKRTGEKPRDIIEMFSGSLWDEITPAECQRLMQLMIERVTICDHNIKIEIRTEGIKSIMEMQNEESDS